MGRSRHYRGIFLEDQLIFPSSPGAPGLRFFRPHEERRTTPESVYTEPYENAARIIAEGIIAGLAIAVIITKVREIGVEETEAKFRKRFRRSDSMVELLERYGDCPPIKARACAGEFERRNPGL